MVGLYSERAEPETAKTVGPSRSEKLLAGGLNKMKQLMVMASSTDPSRGDARITTDAPAMTDPQTARMAYGIPRDRRVSNEFAAHWPG
jgi:hypothetical protein